MTEAIQSWTENKQIIWRVGAGGDGLWACLGGLSWVHVVCQISSFLSFVNKHCRSRRYMSSSR